MLKNNTKIQTIHQKGDSMDSLSKYKIGTGFMTTLGSTNFCSKVVSGKLEDDDKLAGLLVRYGNICKIGNITVVRHSEGVCLENDNMSIILWTQSNGDPIGLEQWKFITQEILSESIHTEGKVFELKTGKETRTAHNVALLYERHLRKCEIDSEFQKTEEVLSEKIRAANKSRDELPLQNC